MKTPNRLPKRLLWTALLFLFTGAGTAGAAIEDFVVQVAYPAIEGATGSFSAGAIFSLVVGVSLGVFYFWAGFGLLRRQERWRRRAVYLSRILVGLLVLCFAIFLFGETAGFELEGSWAGDQSGELPTFPLPVVRLLGLLLLGIMAGAYSRRSGFCRATRSSGSFPGRKKRGSLPHEEIPTEEISTETALRFSSLLFET